MKLSSGLHAAARRQAYVLLIYSYGASVQERVCAEGRVKHTSAGGSATRREAARSTAYSSGAKWSVKVKLCSWGGSDRSDPEPRSSPPPLRTPPPLPHTAKRLILRQ